MQPFDRLVHDSRRMRRTDCALRLNPILNWFASDFEKLGVCAFLQSRVPKLADSAARLQAIGVLAESRRARANFLEPIPDLRLMSVACSLRALSNENKT